VPDFELGKQSGIGCVKMGQLLVRGGLMIDGTGAPPVENGAVLIEGGQIVAVGQEKEIVPKPTAKVMDCSDQVLIPGLIDCHNHCSLDTTLKDYQARMEDSDAEQTLRSISNLGKDLKSGVTTSRCLGDKNFLDVALKRAIGSGGLSGPRLFVATRGIRASHAHGVVAYPFDGPEQVRRAVRENIKAGADLIKIFTTSAIRGEGEIIGYFSREEISVAVQEAHRAGLRAAAHCIGGTSLGDCMEVGVDSIEHGYFITDQQIDLLVKSNCWIVLTASPFFAEERFQVRTRESAESYRRWRDAVAERMSAVIHSGAKFAVGTDGLHGGLARELEYLVDFWGAKESEALLAATRLAAELLGLEGSLGTLEVGKAADLIGLKDNPLKNIKALQQVKTIICNGRLFRPESKDKKQESLFPKKDSPRKAKKNQKNP
jgi:imidazolonepropionase-like amidohydrolase